VKGREAAKLVVRTAKRHPKSARRVATYAIRHRRGLVRTALLARVARRRLQRLPGHLTDRRVQKELLAAVESLRAAATRSHQLGPAGALDDKRVRQLVATALRHFEAARRHQPGQRRHTARSVAVTSILAGMAAAAGRARVLTHERHQKDKRQEA